MKVPVRATGAGVIVGLAVMAFAPHAGLTNEAASSASQMRGGVGITKAPVARGRAHRRGSPSRRPASGATHSRRHRPTPVEVVVHRIRPASAPAPRPIAPQAPPAPAQVSAPAPAPAQVHASSVGFGCAAADAYLRKNANPAFAIRCPGYAMGHEAMTCMDMPGVCPGQDVIIIADPCPQAYENEAWNSWHLSTGPFDPYGWCSTGPSGTVGQGVASTEIASGAP